MRRLALLLATVSLLLAPNPTVAQSDSPRVYMMFFQVDFPDIPAWIEIHRQHEVPILDSLVEEGTLLAYDLWVHDTGGEYNVRYNFVAPNWDALGDFQEALYQRMDPGVWEKWFSMIRKHTDEIWAISASDIPEGGSMSPVVYESSFFVDFARQAEWNADFETYGRPALERAKDEGLIGAWAELHHDTGGPWNVKYVYWLDSWDAADDAFARMGEIQKELGRDPESGRMIRGHVDDVWRTVTGSNR